MERRRLREQAAVLETQLRAAYAMGQQPYLKMLLNQEQPAAAARVAAYYRYFNAARLERIEDIRESLARLAGLEEEVRARREELSALRETQAQEKRILEETRAQRSRLLASLNRDIRDRTQEMARLKADEDRLERLLKEIKTYVPETLQTPVPGRQERFVTLKGRLPLPFPGRITARYGEPRGLGDLRWRGVFLTGKEGQAIRAVSRGRVAYADWLRGFGLLLILDHGDGYMTLYGHNQTLYPKVGDWVEAGQAIATVGNTGDAPGTGVYFEIRHNGSPHDPLHWCATGRATRARR
jgi:septal ring factor EnvC (AmiA/AmiB activator)